MTVVSLGRSVNELTEPVNIFNMHFGDLSLVYFHDFVNVYSILSRHFRLLKTCVTDESHPGLHVCFW